MKIFLVGIGGIAMGNLARMLQEIGHEVSGSDQNLYPPMSDQLVNWGLSPKKGYSAENVNGQDLVIIGNAISRGNPEVEEILNSGIPYMSMSQALGHFFLKDKKVIVVAGTHGKTTTTFLLHYILKQLGLEPGLFVGGIRKDNHPGFEVGKGEWFVIEGDEYDSAFFDKGSKFLHYKPYYLITTALDYDHADIFKDLEAIRIQFRRLLRLVPSKGKIFFWEGSSELTTLTKEFKFAVSESYELGKKNSVLTYKKGILNWRKDKLPIRPKLIGLHNHRNAEAAVRVALNITPDREQEIQKAFISFPGVKRRQDVRFEDHETIVMEDFAHHPVAIRETILAVSEAFPEYKIISLFEPRSATSHTDTFQKEFSKSFQGSSIAFITEVFNTKKVSKDKRLDVHKLCTKLHANSRAIGVYCKTPKDLLTKLKKMLPAFKDEKVAILAMSNGAFGGIYSELVEIAKSRKG
ncbi:UDP-N-acetylmuramate--L-alanine ligase [Leptospira sp. GIMC2001]|uniref:UDP-N-acetylmuramate--L-alanine ligase n=1 Tax=Leptospira sp. GIMC2001 TaxID=1513297 RepID=UPI0023495128|nr:Mur ligase domain-containing protein [Leptospira sp. GIMC2001]WCL50030.1 Mur ligase domain-containing protein [Leptospira sp. GIMC2001]